MININVSSPNDGLGDKLRDAFVIVNDNFTEVSSIVQDIIDNNATQVELDTAIGILNTSINDISLILDTKSDIGHTHIISEIQGLQSALNALTPLTSFNSNISLINNNLLSLQAQINNFNQEVTNLTYGTFADKGVVISSTGTDAIIPLSTIEDAGLMSPTDKVKLDAVILGPSITNTSELVNDGSDGTSTYVETDELGSVAFSNDYNDLNNLPSLQDVVDVGNTTNKDIYINSNTIGNGPGNSQTNLVFGSNAFNNNTSGTYNVSFGEYSMSKNTTAYNNIGIGAYSLFENITGSFNTAIGTSALQNNTSTQNLAIGSSTLRYNTTGQRNTGIGTSALQNNVSGNYNTAIGNVALYRSTGNDNIGIGRYAGSNIVSGNRNIIFSNNSTSTSSGLNTGSDNIIIGSSVTGIINGDGNVIIGKNSGLDSTLNNNVIISDGSGTNKLTFNHLGDLTIPSYPNTRNDLGTMTNVLFTDASGILNSKPITDTPFAFTGHTHSISDTTGLQTALDGKLDKDISSLSGVTLPLVDTDKLIVNRAGVDYSVAKSELSSVGPLVFYKKVIFSNADATGTGSNVFFDGVLGIPANTLQAGDTIQIRIFNYTDTDSTTSYLTYVVFSDSVRPVYNANGRICTGSTNRKWGYITRTLDVISATETKGFGSGSQFWTDETVGLNTVYAAQNGSFYQNLFTEDTYVNIYINCAVTRVYNVKSLEISVYRNN